MTSPTTELSGKPQELVLFLRDYARSRLNSRLFDARRCIPPYVVLDFGRNGILGLRAPREYGGLALSYRDSIPVIGQLAAIDLSLSMLAGIHNGLGIGTLMACGTAAAQEELLPLLATGRMLGGFAITEDGAGSDPRAIRGTAELQPGGSWRLNAEKIWVGNGSWAGMLNVFVRRRGDGQRGVAGFVVKTGKPGVIIGPESMTMGMRSIVQNRIVFSEVEVEPEYALRMTGPTESLFHLARFGLAVVCCGALKRCAQLMLRYATRRTISSGPLVENPVFRAAVARVMNSVRLLERLCMLIADRLDAGRPVPPELFFVCKAAGPEYLGYGVDQLIQFMGGRGYIETNEAPQLLRDARLLRIFEGATETMRSHLGSMWQGGSRSLREFLNQPGEGARILQRIETSCEEIRASPRPERRTIGQQAFARYAAVGEVVAEGVLWWLASQPASSQALAEWARERFEDAFARGLRAAGTEPDLDATALQDELRYSIGDVVQMLPGEDWGLDPMLAP